MKLSRIKAWIDTIFAIGLPLYTIYLIKYGKLSSRVIAPMEWFDIIIPVMCYLLLWMVFRGFVSDVEANPNEI